MMRLPNPYKHWLRGSFTSARDIQKVVKETAIRCKVKDIYPEITWGFSNRLVASVGIAQWWVDDYGNKYWDMRFASQLWMGMEPDDRKNTIVHEVCHLAIQRLHDHSTPGIKTHGDEWRELMLVCGEDPDKSSYGNW
jgi:predicted SprT family Zn-dependent metalloprotease